MSDRRKRINRRQRVQKQKLNGRVVHSDFEFYTYNTLKPLLPKKAAIAYESEQLPYVIEYLYRPDFVIEFHDGSKMYIETKGYFSYSDRQKMLAVRDKNPDLDIRIIFQRNSPSCLGKGSKTRPSEWAEKNGFKFAIGEVPKDWFKNE